MAGANNDNVERFVEPHSENAKAATGSPGGKKGMPGSLSGPPVTPFSYLFYQPKNMMLGNAGRD
jgi:hypothetical protein